MVATAEAAGTRTVALLTDMGQPLGRAAGNWIELVESASCCADQRRPESEDLRELSLILAGWMIHLGGKADTPEEIGLCSSPKQRSRTARPCTSSSR
jgi:thymidine phosphorylase